MGLVRYELQANQRCLLPKDRRYRRLSAGTARNRFRRCRVTGAGRTAHFLERRAQHQLARPAAREPNLVRSRRRVVARGRRRDDARRNLRNQRPHRGRGASRRRASGVPIHE